MISVVLIFTLICNLPEYSEAGKMLTTLSMVGKDSSAIPQGDKSQTVTEYKKLPRLIGFYSPCQVLEFGISLSLSSYYIYIIPYILRIIILVAFYVCVSFHFSFSFSISHAICILGGTNFCWLDHENWKGSIFFFLQFTLR